MFFHLNVCYYRLELLSLQRIYIDKMQEEQNKSSRPWRRFFKIAGINLGIMVVVIVLILWILSLWLGAYTRHEERIDVPDLSGVEAEEAAYYLDRLGLKSMVIDSVYTDGRRGAVIEQMPVAGLPVKKGRIVYLTINAKSQRMVKMIDVREWSSRQAQSRLREVGFVIDSVKQVASEFDDLVLSVSANGAEVIPGKEYPFHTRVVVRVGSSHIQLVAENDSTESEWF